MQAVTLLRHLQMTDPDASPTIASHAERRVRDWRALHGEAKDGAANDVIFRQTPEPDRMALSDFTDREEDQRALRRKPQALAGSVYRDSLFPASRVRRLGGAVRGAPQADACRRMTDLLWRADDEGCEAEPASLLLGTLPPGGCRTRDLKARLEPRRRELPDDVPVTLTALAHFDALLDARP